MKKFLSALIFLQMAMTKSTYAMHISEGYLTPKDSIMWWIFYLPFFLFGIKALRKHEKVLNKKLVIALVAAFVFFISAIKLPSVTGSSSHATGIALGTILLGACEMYIIGGIVLLFQAIILAHGGLTTLGANAMSMAVLGAISAGITYKIFKHYNKEKLGIFFAALISNLFTYSFTAFELALSHGGDNLLGVFGKFLSLFAITQIPLGIIEGLVTVMVIGALRRDTNIFKGGENE